MAGTPEKILGIRSLRAGAHPAL